MGNGMKQFALLSSALLVFAAGCGVNSTFVYKPGPAGGGGPALPMPMKAAVLPFADGTENFTKRGSVFAPETLTYNVAKAGITGTITALTPELWAKSFAEELAAEKIFRSVRFIYSPQELADEDLYIEGTVEKAYASGAWAVPSEYAVAFRAFRRADKQPVWSREVTRMWKTPPELYKGCGMSMQCMVNAVHADTNRMMQGMFAEAAADLAAALGGQPSAGVSPPAGSAVTAPAGAGTDAGAGGPAGGSVDETIERILREK